MIKPEDIRHLRTTSLDYDETETLKAEFRKRRQERRPFFLTAEELDRVFRWKLRSQYGRPERHRARNSDTAYHAVTEAVFKIIGPDLEYESVVRLGLLIALPGVGVPCRVSRPGVDRSGAILVIDFWGWRTVFGEDRTAFSTTDYLRYRSEVARVAVDLGWPVQEADLAIWEYDRGRSEHSA